MHLPDPVPSVDAAWKARRLRRCAGMLLGVLAAALLLACSQSSGNVVRIYSSVPLQGSGGPENATIVSAIRMALADHNGRAGPYKVEYVSLDDSTKAKGKWDAAQEQANARRAVADPLAVAYLGTVNSGAAKVSIPILDRVRLAMVSFGNTYPGLTKSSGALSSEPYIYAPLGPDARNYCRVLPTDDLQGAAGALYAQKSLNAKSVYVLDDTELYGHGIAQIFADKAKQIGLQVLGGPEGIDTRTSQQADAGRAETARRVAQAKPDLVYFGGIAENHAGQLFKDLRNDGFQGIFMGPDGIVEKAFLDEAGSNPARVYGTFTGLPPNKLTGPGAAWYTRFKSENGEPGPYAAYGYEAMNAVLNAIAKAGKADRAAVLKALRGEQQVQGIVGTWSFDPNCDTTLTTISVNVPQGGDWVFKEVAPSS